jgi:hypothetical protein
VLYWLWGFALQLLMYLWLGWLVTNWQIATPIDCCFRHVFVTAPVAARCIGEAGIGCIGSSTGEAWTIAQRFRWERHPERKTIA